MYTPDQHITVGLAAGWQVTLRVRDTQFVDARLHGHDVGGAMSGGVCKGRSNGSTSSP